MKKIKIFMAVVVFFLVFLSATNAGYFAALRVKNRVLPQQKVVQKVQEVKKEVQIKINDPQENLFDGNSSDSLKQALIGMANLIRHKISSKDFDVAEIKKMLEYRKNLLMEFVKKGDTKNLKSAFFDNEVLSKLGKIGAVESFKKIKGKAEVAYFDDFENNKAWEELRIRVVDDKFYKLLPLDDYKNGSFQNGDTVELFAYIMDDLAFYSYQDEIKIIETEHEPVLGEQKVLVLMANFSNTEIPDYGKEEVEEAVFGKVNDYFKETSYNKMYLSGDVYGWYQLDMEQNCGRYSVASLLNDILKEEEGVEASGYDYEVIIADFGECGWAGAASGNLSTIQSYTIPNGWGITAHELGHNFDNGHALFVDCGIESSYIQDLDSCNKHTYGDLYDVMGNSSRKFQFNAIHKLVPGWMNEDQYKIVDKSGVYKLTPIEIDGTNKAIGIDQGQGNFLILEYRQPIGGDDYFKNGNESNIYEGVLPHLYLPGVSKKTYLFDANPDIYADVFNSVILPNEVFHDPSTGTDVRILSLNEDEVSLDVKLGKIDFEGPEVFVYLKEKKDVYSGIVDFVAEAKDKSGIEKVEFYHGATLFATDYDAPYEGSLDTKNSFNGGDSVYAIAYDRAGEDYNAFNNRTRSDEAQFNIQNEDDIYPEIKILNPNVEEGVFYDDNQEMIEVKLRVEDNLGLYSFVSWQLYNDETNEKIFDYWKWLDVYEKDGKFYFEDIINIENPGIGSYKFVVDVSDNTWNESKAEFLFKVVDKDLDKENPKVEFINPKDGDVFNVSVLPIKVKVSDNTGLKEVKLHFVSATQWWTDIPWDKVENNIYEANFDIAKNVIFKEGDPNQAIWFRVEALDVVDNLSRADAKIKYDNKRSDLIIFSPKEGDWVSEDVKVEVSAQDNQGVDRVELYLGGTDKENTSPYEPDLVEVDRDAPYIFKWDSTQTDSLSAFFRIDAYDVAGNRISNQVNFYIDNGSPSVILHDPTDGKVISGVYRLYAEGADWERNMDRIEFYLDDVLLTGDYENEVDQSTHLHTKLNWDSSQVSDGEHILKARGYDETGLWGESDEVRVVVK